VAIKKRVWATLKYDLVFKVAATGFEPATMCSQSTWRG